MGFEVRLPCLLHQHDAKRAFSIDKVRAELLASKDRLSAWVKNTAPATLFKGTTDKSVLDAYQDMVKWVQAESQFTSEAKTEFASLADGWIIAYVKANSHVVVTHEEYAPGARNKVKMPNLCVEYQVEYCNTFEMLRDLKIQFVLPRRKPK